MRRTLNVAVALCENRCVAPPGFLVEDMIAFELGEAQRAYLAESVFQLPLREDNLADFAEKKRIGYEPMRNRYSGLFDDTRIGFLNDNANGLIRRKTLITENILEQWRGGPESGHKIWKNVKSGLGRADIDFIARVPVVLNDRGTALTWAAIQPELPPGSSATNKHLRNVLQNIYLRQYCSEFKLVVVSAIPHLLHDFQLPARRNSYSYQRFSAFLDVFGLRDVILDAPADLLVALRRKDGFISFIDAYVELAERLPGNTALTFAASRAARDVDYGWSGIEKRRAGLFELSPVEQFELDDVLREVAKRLSAEHQLPTREREQRQQGTSIQTERSKPIVITSAAAPDLVLFVALQEELDVLAKALKLAKSHLSPAASGILGDVSIDVICPKAMGRVPAAVQTANYLSMRTHKPKLIIIVGLAGGFEENNTAVGHAICATAVYDLAQRKIVDDAAGGTALKFRRRDYNLNGALRAVLTSDSFDQRGWAEYAQEQFDWPSDRRPSIHYGPVVSADEVVASDTWRRQILTAGGGQEKSLGVEMEAGGVCAAAEAAKVDVCMLRIVSDSADPSKADDEWRKRGMRTLANLLQRLPIEALFEAL